MRTTFILIILIVFSASSFGQKIHFTDTQNVWTYVHITDQIPPFEIYNQSWHFTGDTVVNNIVYKKLKMTGAHGPLTGMVREDIPNGKVYGKYGPGYTPSLFDTSEQLLFNYNLGVGDTIKRVISGHTYFSVVISVDSVLLNSVWHKIQHFDNSDSITHYVDYYVTEGIGNRYDAFYSARPMAIEPTSGLCSFTRGASYYYGNATSCNLAVNEEKTTDVQKISIRPNPAGATTMLVCQQPVQKGWLTIYSTLGQKIFSLSVTNQTSIPIGTHLSILGQYFYRLVDENKHQAYTGSFIFQ